MLRWQEMRVVQDADGNPGFEVTGGLAEHLDSLGIDVLHLSMSHDAGIASAFVVLERSGGSGA